MRKFNSVVLGQKEKSHVMEMCIQTAQVAGAQLLLTNTLINKKTLKPPQRSMLAVYILLFP